jgi:hypothetical protein
MRRLWWWSEPSSSVVSRSRADRMVPVFTRSRTVGHTCGRHAALLTGWWRGLTDSAVIAGRGPTYLCFEPWTDYHRPRPRT